MLACALRAAPGRHGELCVPPSQPHAYVRRQPRRPRSRSGVHGAAGAAAAARRRAPPFPGLRAVAARRRGRGLYLSGQHTPRFAGFGHLATRCFHAARCGPPANAITLRSCQSFFSNGGPYAAPPGTKMYTHEHGLCLSTRAHTHTHAHARRALPRLLAVSRRLRSAMDQQHPETLRRACGLRSCGLRRGLLQRGAGSGLLYVSGLGSVCAPVHDEC